MKIKLDFYTRYKPESKTWECYSILSTLIGIGETEMASIKHHILRFEKLQKASAFSLAAQDIPGATKVQFIFNSEKVC